jgi:hypothetical protein
VRITVAESAFEIRPSGQPSGYLNFTLSQAYSIGPTTGDDSVLGRVLQPAPVGRPRTAVVRLDLAM